LTAILVVGGITYIYMRQNAVDANLQAQQNQQTMQQMGQELKKAPEAAAQAMHEEVQRLNDQLKAADERNDQRMRHLSQQLTEQEAITKQAVRDLAERQQSQSMPATAPADVPSATPATLPVREVNPRDYDASVRQGVSLLQNGDPEGALKVAQQLMQNQPNRWEAYSIAASVAKVQNKPSQAKSMFEKALSLAPDEVKPSLQQALQEISRGGQ
jgi:tetratricopeptide (TPR) repeat protein